MLFSLLLQFFLESLFIFVDGLRRTLITFLLRWLVLLEVSHSVLFKVKPMLLVSIHRFILVFIIILELVQLQIRFEVAMQHSNFIILNVFDDLLSLRSLSLREFMHRF